MNKPNIFVYWEDVANSVRPVFIDMCYETMERNSGCDITYVTDKNIGDYLPDLRTDLDRISTIAQKCDYIRLKLLEKYGGIYLDSDFVVFRNLAELYNTMLMNGKKFLGIKLPTGEVFNNNILCTKDCDIIKNTAKYIDHILDTNLTQTSFSWMSLGSEALQRFDNDECMFIRVEQMVPTDWYRYAGIATKNGLDKYVNSDTYCFALHNAQFGRLNRPEPHMTREQIMTTDTAIGQVFRKAYGE